MSYGNQLGTVYCEPVSVPIEEIFFFFFFGNTSQKIELVAYSNANIWIIQLWW